MIAHIHAVLVPLGGDKFRVTGVGTPNFWPHDGDIVTKNAIPHMKEKGWTVEIQKAGGEYAD